ncbi:hypothetical protein BDB01DRAFT_851501 [Pilobolus umbonatus]|nr:hypothetical protein BDB01DRAFT_851501 [Pilobolus umbonatus]
MNQRRSVNKINKTNANNRKRSHSSSSSPNTTLFSATSSSDSCSSSLPSVKSQSKKKRVSIINESTDSSADSTNTSSSQLTPITPNSSNTTPTPTYPRMNAQRSVPAFLNKLYNMVEDTSTNNLIRWSNDGSSFIVERHEEFAKAVLPRFYKHNTFASFVRQLNMYDFHKIPHLQQGVLIAETEHEIWEFSNPHFQRGRPDLLVLVTRKRNRDRDSTDTENVTISSLVQDLATVKSQQANIGSELEKLNRDNDILWHETLNAREKYQRHQEAIEKILQFLTAVFTSSQFAIENTDGLPKALIEEAASLAGISTKQEDIKKANTSCSPFSSNALSNILSSILRLYSTNPPPDLQQNTYPMNHNKPPPHPTNHTMNANNMDRRMEDNPPKNKTKANHKLNTHCHMNSGTTIDNMSRTTNGTNPAVDSVNDSFRTDYFSPTQNHEFPNTVIKNNDPTLIDFSRTLNTATKSAQNITQDIDMLQINIESLARNLGIDPNQLDEDMESENFQENYNHLMNSCDSANKSNMFNEAPNAPCFDPKKDSQLALIERERYNYNSMPNTTLSYPHDPSIPSLPPSHVSPLSGRPSYPVQYTSDNRIQEGLNSGYSQFISEMRYAGTLKLNQVNNDDVENYFTPLHMQHRTFEDSTQNNLGKTTLLNNNSNNNNNNTMPTTTLQMSYYSQEPTPENIVGSGSNVHVNNAYSSVNGSANPKYSGFIRPPTFYNNIS